MTHRMTPYRPRPVAYIEVFRDIQSDEHQTVSVGRCVLPNRKLFQRSFYVLELPYRNNDQSVSCIPPGPTPEGQERAFRMYRTTIVDSANHGICLALHDVPDRELIRCHKGNFRRNTRGCPLPGFGLKHLDDDGLIDVTGSGDALDQLLRFWRAMNKRLVPVYWKVWAGVTVADAEPSPLRRYIEGLQPLPPRPLDALPGTRLPI